MTASSRGERALDECLDEQRFGAAGTHVIVEELLSGPEVSVFGLSDGRRVRTLVPARDHKRIFDGDRGPNTGGMGSIAPPPDIDAATRSTRMSRGRCSDPCIDALRERGTPFVGCLVRGVDAHGRRAARPRVQRAIRRSGGAGDPARCSASRRSRSSPRALAVRSHAGIAASVGGAAVGVVAAAAGYPGDVRRGDVITGIETLDPDVLCFHAGTRRDTDGTLRTSGGRVLCVTALGADLAGRADPRVWQPCARALRRYAVRSDIGGPVTAGSRA